MPKASRLRNRKWKRRGRLRTVTHLFIFLLMAMGVAVAQNAPLDRGIYREIWEKSQIFNPKPSFDTTPVTVRVVSVVYRIPRNYLTMLEPMTPTLKLMWPGLQPLTVETQQCFGSIAQGERAGCASFNFPLLGSRGPGPDGFALTNSEKFENFRRYFPNATSRHGPFGYDIYNLGPKAPSEYYRRVDRDIFFSCDSPSTLERKGSLICNNMFRLDDMNHMRFFFRSDYIEHVAEIEASMRRLMASFVVRKDEQ